MFQAFDFCLPTRGIKVPDRPEWIHEVKYDGYRLRVESDGDRVRLIARRLQLDEALSLDRRGRAEKPS
jgi:ATP-dependent DNA ligase